MASGSSGGAAASRVVCRMYRTMLRELGMGVPRGTHDAVLARAWRERAGHLGAAAGATGATGAATAAAGHAVPAAVKPSRQPVYLILPPSAEHTGEYTGPHPRLHDRVLGRIPEYSVDVAGTSRAAVMDRVHAWLEDQGLAPDAFAATAPMVERAALAKLVRGELEQSGLGPLDVFCDSARVLTGLRDFRLLEASTSVAQVGCVSVEITTSFNVNDGDWFSYRVHVRNTSKDPHQKVRLQGRHWLFKRPDGRVVNAVEKWGNGVIGRNPLLGAGDGFEYSSKGNNPSSHDLRAGDETLYCGSMEGAFLFEDLAAKENFEVPIPPTMFVRPRWWRDQ